MDIIVCIKQVPGSTIVDMDPDTGTLLRGSAETRLNPYDLYAIETALRMRESYGGTVRVISMGPPSAEAVIREAFSMGADGGSLLSDFAFAGADVLATGYTLSQGIRKMGHFDLVLCGKQTTDGDTAQTGAEIAAFLEIPAIANVRHILGADEISVTVEADLLQEVAVIRAKLPCLLSVEKDISQPRLPSWRKKIETADRPVQILGLSDLPDRDPKHYGPDGSPTTVQRIFPPPPGPAREVWADTGEALADALYEKLAERKFVSR